MPRYPGVFNISAATALNVTISGGTRQLMIYKNGTTPVARTQLLTHATGTDSIAVSGSVHLNGTTDYIEIQVFQDSTVPGTVLNEDDSTYFMGSRAA